MSLSDLASLGSFVSGVGVVISLIWLAIQTRQNTHILMRTEANAAQEQASRWRLTVASSAELATIFIKGGADDDLSEIEERRFALVLQDMCYAMLQGWDRQRRGIIGTDTFKGGVRRFAALLTSQRGAAWWEGNREFFPPDYAMALDAAIRSARDSGLSVTRSGGYLKSAH